MKTLLVAETRNGALLSSAYELLAFADKLGAESALFLVASEDLVPKYNGTVYLADVAKHGEFNPDVHKQLVLNAVSKEQPDLIVFHHSSYGWDLAPRIALALNAAQISEVIDVCDNTFVVPACNGKLRRDVHSKTTRTVITLQPGAFCPDGEPNGAPKVVPVDTDMFAKVTFESYVAADTSRIDLSKAEIVVSAGRGVRKMDNMAKVSALAEALGGELGASRPVVDAEWLEHNRQIGTTGQSVSPKLYVACGISGAIQHIAGMKKSEFVIAINTDKDAPIAEIADVLAVADVNELLPALTERLLNR